jgi:hypothetical protein
MKKLVLDLQNCHGIRSLKSTLDFHQKSAIAIYAPNGAMKTSLANTFQDLKHGNDSHDGIFPERTSIRIIQDESGQDVLGSDVVVVLSYDEELGPTEATSTLLVNQVLRKEYESLQEELFVARDELVTGIKAQAGTRQDVSKLISRSFTKEDDNFFVALSRIYEELTKQSGAPFANVPYDILFNEKVRAIADTAEFGASLTEYVTRLNELLDKSVFFSRNSFSYYNASNVTKSLGDNKYFQANHTLTLRGSDGKHIEVTNAKQLDDLVTEEQQRITEDEVLRKKLLAIKKLLERNAETRAFYEYVAEHVEILPELNAFNLFEDKVWKSYLKVREPLYAAVVGQWRKTEDRKDEIEKQAAAESTQWERVIAMFNERFFVPFRLTAKNRERVVLGLENVLQLIFEFEDGIDRATVEKGELLKILSMGEKKALYILNVLFEVEARKIAGTGTLFIIDDLADSFDYRNKYAIIQYIHEMTENQDFKLVVLTHNFDFFRTLNGRGIAGYNNCLTAQRTSTEIELVPASGIKNPFIHDFKPHFFDDPMKRIASIPFVRNILEYTKGDSDPDFLKLTSILHWKADSSSITNADLDTIFIRLFGGSESFGAPSDSVVDLVLTQARNAVSAPQGINFENKIVLSIAIRLLAEQYMEAAIGDPSFFSSITSNQTQVLHRECKVRGLGTAEQRKVLDSVLLMTPENLHVNSFMYEPIIDLADEHLRKLYHEVIALAAPPTMEEM